MKNVQALGHLVELLEPKDGPGERLSQLLGIREKEFLEHLYFRRCAEGDITRTQLVGLLKQLYCFSVFFERLLARRIAEYSTSMDSRIIRIAREHMTEEIAHSDLFLSCLVDSGVAEKDVYNTLPKMFTKSLFGYLAATIIHDNEYVSNVAIMQVMESIGQSFFGATLNVMRVHDMPCEAFELHAEADDWHSQLGIELLDSFDETTEREATAVINDIYRLMGFVLNEWASDEEQWSGGSEGEVSTFQSMDFHSRITGLRPPPMPGESAQFEED